MDQVFYTDDLFPDEKGQSLSFNLESFTSSQGEINLAQLNDYSENWCSSYSELDNADFGTPGSANDSCE